MERVILTAPGVGAGSVDEYERFGEHPVQTLVQ